MALVTEGPRPPTDRLPLRGAQLRGALSGHWAGGHRYLGRSSARRSSPWAQSSSTLCGTPGIDQLAEAAFQKAYPELRTPGLPARPLAGASCRARPPGTCPRSQRRLRPWRGQGRSGVAGDRGAEGPREHGAGAAAERAVGVDKGRTRPRGPPSPRARALLLVPARAEPRVSSWALRTSLWGSRLRPRCFLGFVLARPHRFLVLVPARTEGAFPELSLRAPNSGSRTRTPRIPRLSFLSEKAHLEFEMGVI